MQMTLAAVEVVTVHFVDASGTVALEAREIDKGTVARLCQCTDNFTAAVTDGLEGGLVIRLNGLNPKSLMGTEASRHAWYSLKIVLHIMNGILLIKPHIVVGL